MSKRIFKYPIPTSDGQVMSLPIGAELLTVQVQREVPTIWARVDDEADTEERLIRTYGTGQMLPDYPGEYIGTYQLHGGDLVFHVYDLGPIVPDAATRWVP